ncbi:hypothetical protein [Candidatus Poriferisodalis sp.]
MGALADDVTDCAIGDPLLALSDQEQVPNATGIASSRAVDPEWLRLWV